MNPSARLKVGFAGTPEFATPALGTLCESKSIDVVAVYTQPDRPAGRGRQISHSPVKTLALEHRIPVFQPQNFKADEDLEKFKALGLDVFVVAAYGLILPKPVLDAVRYPINIHASLLPRWRGAAPIQRAIMAGDKSSGITIIRITEMLDAGPIWNTLSCEISPTETAGSLHDKLALLGAQAIEEAVEDIVHDRVVETEQNEASVCYAEKITNADREINWDRDAKSLERLIRGLNPTPVATTTLGQQKCKIWEADVDKTSGKGPPGTIAYADNNAIGVNTGDGILRITRLQPAGKKALTAREFLNGYADRLALPVE